MLLTFKLKNMLELQEKIEEYWRVMDELVERALNHDIEKDSKDWNKLDEIEAEVKALALLI